MQSFSSNDISHTKQWFIKRYEQISGNKYDEWWIPNGVLEVGRALGLPALQCVLQGCLPPLRVAHLEADFRATLYAMEKGRLQRISQLSYEQVTEPDTLALGLSYRHVERETHEFPRRRMSDVQKQHLLAALKSVAAMRKAKRVVLWIDQVMGQRNPRSERDWVRNGILPYFAFDVLILSEKNDQRRCWLYLEKVISTKYARAVALGEHVQLFEKTHEMGTMTPIQEMASSILGGILHDKSAYDTSDKKQIRRWAAALLRQEVKPVDYHLLVSGSDWESKLYDLKGFKAVINNHIIPTGHVEWRDVSSGNSSKSWHGLCELVGLPDTEMRAAGQDVRAFLRDMGTAYLFKVFTVKGGKGQRMLGVGRCYRGARPPRIILCELHGTRNDKGTRVVATCLLDCDNLVDEFAAQFLEVFFELGGEETVRFGTVHDDKKAAWGAIPGDSDGPPLPLSAEKEERPRNLVNTSTCYVSEKPKIAMLSGWAWFARALRAREIVLDYYIETLQACDVSWS